MQQKFNDLSQLIRKLDRTAPLVTDSPWQLSPICKTQAILHLKLQKIKKLKNIYIICKYWGWILHPNSNSLGIGLGIGIWSRHWSVSNILEEDVE